MRYQFPNHGDQMPPPNPPVIERCRSYNANCARGDIALAASLENDLTMFAEHYARTKIPTRRVWSSQDTEPRDVPVSDDDQVLVSWAEYARTKSQAYRKLIVDIFRS